MIQQILSAMDNLLANAANEGRQPQHWVMPLENWKLIGDAFGKNLIADPSSVGANTYRGVPVHFTQKDMVVGLMTSPDDHLLT